MIFPIHARQNAPTPADILPIAAPLLIGSLFNWGFYGVLSMQVYMYHLAFPNDRWTAKALVYGIYLLDTAQTILVTLDVVDMYAKNFGDVSGLDGMHNEWLAVPVFSSIGECCTVQLYYAYRIRYLAETYNRLLMAVISALALLQSIAGIATGIQAAIIGTFMGLEARAHSVTIIWLGGSAACDVVIAVTMAYLLTHKDTHYPETRAIITRVVHLIVKTGVLTALSAILVLVLYVALPSRAYYACIGAILAKLYSNSLLVLFNTRMHIRGGRNGPSHVHTGPPVRASIRSASHAAAAVSLGAPGGATTMSSFGGVHVHEQVWVHTDGMEMKERSSSPVEKAVVFGLAS
ncbi:uncharacterized protein PHACADRAFT_198296 [Phanerochaete carnosa HHB-10118-sp]|uniref:DUF6534 domain-containing protein n=1 Tax=Phanerochaete carnosa (strain HHB-10118-sp) TaxID=650164 RepID=K5WPG0_PHACS|nr:uncharacterized protein PHACADRAFT_198296 [Phanerochaete carnosa HHB-10118-sp]EKM52232.1 hypothetical protein PHACADRAFT_198296 [Phanerochaete carnosa HHB-10118-sp]